MLRCLFLVCFLSSAIGIVIRDGSCDWENIASVKSLNITELLGEWHQIQHIENPLDTGECSTLTLAVENDNTTSYVTLAHREVHGTHVHDTRGLILIVNETLGLFNMAYQNYTFDTVVLGVNPAKHVVLYSCAGINATQSAVVAWVYSRSTSLEQADKTTVDALIKTNEDLQNATWIEIKHTKEACNINGSFTFGISPILTLLVLFIVGKNGIICN
ncbi:PREDICTED: uncharacterized protein LOC106107095 [Papilio polytes]|uniref:uncharacterized protein LOC106107095 n=1 Tax=Papilio polytes TaxID=76194 RepID=UPI00067618C2|nr:PREDICTED: uncharacterized protein LOC106107095 [Papilio polytes]